MKKFIILSSVLLLALLHGCGQEPIGNTVTEIQPKPDPELALVGIPKDTLDSGQSFSFRVTSLSDGAITVAVDKPTSAILTKKSDLNYEILVVSAKNIKVKVTATQASTTTFAGSSKNASFNVKGFGDIPLPGPDDDIEGTEVLYTEQTGAVLGPERGLYVGYEIKEEGDIPTANDVRAKRLQGYNLQMIEFNLGSFITGDISAAYLGYIQKAFDAIREGGAKAIVRFGYVFEYNEVTDKNKITDPEVEQTLAHVAQLKSVLTKNEDVIFVVQAGFVGAWGEWYYTSHFGMNPSSTESFASRKKLTDALLAALPSSRQIELRVPKYKLKMYSLAVADSLTADSAHDGSASSRLAGHNDCFLADDEDRGTFDSDSSRIYWKAESRYTIMGGETCAVSDYGLCPNTLKDLKDYHWTYLHDSYEPNVINRWKNDGCYGEISARLGYRLVLSDVHYEAVKAGEPCKVTIRFYNKGFAAPMNPREAWLVWVGSDDETVKMPLGFDPRTWHSGYNAAVSTFIPSTDKGTLYLELSDPLLSGKPEYSIPLANTDVFDPETGYNKLFEVK